MGLHGEGVDRDFLGHLDVMESSVRAARESIHRMGPGANEALKSHALHDVRDAVVAGFQLMAQHGVPVGRRPEPPKTP